MFSCACSLRSTQCAALIALAAVAGLARFEPAQAPVESDATSVTRISEADSISASRYFTALASFVFNALQPRRSAETHLVLSANAGTERPASVALALRELPLAVATESQSPIHFAELVALRPSARKHQFPFAVGPPAGAATLVILRADRTHVPGDSTARRMSGSRVARFCAAKTSRSSALRGYPDLPSRSAQAAAVRARDGHFFSGDSHSFPTRLFS
jgi:hypothetical protein